MKKTTITEIVIETDEVRILLNNGSEVMETSAGSVLLCPATLCELTAEPGLRSEQELDEEIR